MKKVLKILGLVVLVLATLAVVAFVLIKTGIIDLDKPAADEVRISTNSQGYMFTERLWSWKPIEYRGKITYIENTAGVQTQTVSLCLGGSEYIDLQVPAESSYIWDFGKTIWASDGSYQIRLIKGITMDNIGITAGIDNGESLTPTVLTTREGVKGCRSIAAIIGDYAVIANVYQGDETYSVLRQSILNAEVYSRDNTYEPTTKNVDDVSYTGSYVAQVVFQKVSLEQQRYLFQSGALYVQSEVRPMHDICDEYLNRLAVFAGQEPSMIYYDGGILYAEAGDCYLSLITYNANTTIVLLGNGEEAKCNEVSIIAYLQ